MSGTSIRAQSGVVRASIPPSPNWFLPNALSVFDRWIVYGERNSVAVLRISGHAGSRPTLEAHAQFSDRDTPEDKVVGIAIEEDTEHSDNFVFGVLQAKNVLTVCQFTWSAGGLGTIEKLAHYIGDRSANRNAQAIIWLPTTSERTCLFLASSGSGELMLAAHNKDNFELGTICKSLVRNDAINAIARTTVADESKFECLVGFESGSIEKLRCTASDGTLWISCVTRYRHHAAAISGLMCQKNTFASMDRSGFLAVWDTEQNGPLHQRNCKSGKTSKRGHWFAFALEGDTVFHSDETGKLSKWHLPSNNTIRAAGEAHNRVVFGILRQGSTILSYSQDRALACHSIGATTMKPKVKWTLPTIGGKTADLDSPGGEGALTLACGNPPVLVWNPLSQKYAILWRQINAEVTCLRRIGTDLLLLGDRDGSVVFYAPRSQTIRTIHQHAAPCEVVDLATDSLGYTVFSVDTTGVFLTSSIRKDGSECETLECDLSPPIGKIRTLRFAQESQQLILGATSGSIHTLSGSWRKPRRVKCVESTGLPLRHIPVTSSFAIVAYRHGQMRMGNLAEEGLVHVVNTEVSSLDDVDAILREHSRTLVIAASSGSRILIFEGDAVTADINVKLRLTHPVPGQDIVRFGLDQDQVIVTGPQRSVLVCNVDGLATWTREKKGSDPVVIQLRATVGTQVSADNKVADSVAIGIKDLHLRHAHHSIQSRVMHGNTSRKALAADLIEWSEQATSKHKTSWCDRPQNWPFAPNLSIVQEHLQTFLRDSSPPVEPFALRSLGHVIEQNGLEILGREVLRNREDLLLALALAPQYGEDCWREFGSLVAEQLLLMGDINTAATILVAINTIETAIETLMRADRFLDAFLLARFHFRDEDPRVKHICMRAGEGLLDKEQPENAAKFYLFAGEPNKAREAVNRRNDTLARRILSALGEDRREYQGVEKQNSNAVLGESQHMVIAQAAAHKILTKGSSINRTAQILAVDILRGAQPLVKEARALMRYLADIDPGGAQSSDKPEIVDKLVQMALKSSEDSNPALFKLSSLLDRFDEDNRIDKVVTLWSDVAQLVCLRDWVSQALLPLPVRHRLRDVVENMLTRWQLDPDDESFASCEPLPYRELSTHFPVAGTSSSATASSLALDALQYASDIVSSHT
eukprot:Clim_evm59s229 gene=Clim_evmTU59s229